LIILSGSWWPTFPELSLMTSILFENKTATRVYFIIVELSIYKLKYLLNALIRWDLSFLEQVLQLIFYRKSMLFHILVSFNWTLWIVIPCWGILFLILYFWYKFFIHQLEFQNPHCWIQLEFIIIDFLKYKDSLNLFYCNFLRLKFLKFTNSSILV